jgi:hypothetical protein
VVDVDGRDGAEAEREEESFSSSELYSYCEAARCWVGC